MAPAPALAPVVPPPAALPRAPAASPRLSVVIVNYHTSRDTARLVRQLRSADCWRAGTAEVVVVDNHSPGGPLLRRLRRTAGVSLRRWGRNRGFARAVNEGCRLGRGGWLLLLNPDVSVPEGFLDRVLARAEELAASDPTLGVVGFGLRHGDGSPQWSAGPFPTLAGTLARLALPRPRRKYQRLPTRRPCRVPWVTGCCLLVRAACLRQLGGFDEDYFLYYEDVDLCRRARARGWSVWYEPSVAVVHYSPLHRRAVPPALRVLTRHALLTYAAKHWPRWQCLLLGGVVAAEAWLRRLLADWRKDAPAVALFNELGRIARDVAAGRRGAARRRLGRVVRRQEGRLGR